jgi:lipid-binding SYLF domain-containing protein
MNDGGMRHLLSDKFTIGGEASAAAGPLGRNASALTDAQMNAEMLSYSRSRGLFAGVSLEGATLRPDEEANRELYARDATNREILTGDFKAPAAAGKFERALHRESPHRD